MHLCREAKAENIYMGRIERGQDLLESLTAICRENSISLGRVEAIGAVEKARLAYYEQGKQEYREIDLKEPMEILSLKGNISLKENAPMVHVHVTLGDKQGRVRGGHLLPRTMVFACEYILEKFSGPKFTRQWDEKTGLPLWPTDQS